MIWVDQLGKSCADRCPCDSIYICNVCISIFIYTCTFYLLGIHVTITTIDKGDTWNSITASVSCPTHQHPSQQLTMIENIRAAFRRPRQVLFRSQHAIHHGSHWSSWLHHLRRPIEQGCEVRSWINGWSRSSLDQILHQNCIIYYIM